MINLRNAFSSTSSSAVNWVILGSSIALSACSTIPSDETQSEQDWLEDNYYQLLDDYNELYKNYIELEEADQYIGDGQAFQVQNITTDDPFIQTSCPQLQIIQLKTEALNVENLPFIEMDENNKFPIMGDFNIERYNFQDIRGFQIKLYTAEQNENFHLDIESSGGDPDLSEMLIQAIKASKANVSTYVTSFAYSAGADLFTNAHERYISPDATIMLHNTSSPKGYASDLEDGYIKDSMNKTNNFAKEMFLDNSTTDITETCVNALFRDYYDLHIENPKDLLKLGGADYILDWQNRQITSVDFSSTSPIASPKQQPSSP